MLSSVFIIVMFGIGMTLLTFSLVTFIHKLITTALDAGNYGPLVLTAWTIFLLASGGAYIALCG